MSLRQPILGTFCLILAGLIHIGSALAQYMPPPMPPRANDDYAFTTSLAPVTVNVVANDYAMGAPIDPTSVQIVTAPQFGDASVNANGNIVYTPIAGQPGLITMQYVVSSQDGQTSNIANVDIDVIHNPPTAINDSDMTQYQWWADIHVLDNDYRGTADLDPTSIEIVTPPQNGTLEIDTDNGVITYDPTTVEAGNDSFQYRVSDIYGFQSDVATVNVNVINNGPMLSGFSVTKSTVLPNVYTFSGHVDDEEPWLCSVEFGGLLDGYPDVTPNYNGDFLFSVDFGQPVGGSVTAMAVDVAGQESPTASTSILY